MTNPIDLSIEEMRGNLTRDPVTPAPAGTQACCVIVPPSGNACGATATRQIVWPDGDVTPACVDCANNMAALAQSHRTVVTIKEK
jgi:hypothetical protein